MSSQNWYRNEVWSDQIASEFQSKLKRARTEFNKAQYLRIQAVYLFKSTNPEDQKVGVDLIMQLFRDYPMQRSEILGGQEILGDYYLEIGDFTNAEKYFRLVNDHYIKEKSRSWTSAMADLKIAQTILKSKSTDKMTEAYQICKNYPTDDLWLNDRKFYYHNLLALICFQLGKLQEAKHHANLAIQLSTITEPQLSRHKDVGLVDANDNELIDLRKILATS